MRGDEEGEVNYNGRESVLLMEAFLALSFSISRFSESTIFQLVTK